MQNNLKTFSVLYIVKGCLLLFSSIFFWGYIAFFYFIFNSNSELNYEMHSQGEMLFNPFEIIEFIVGIASTLFVIFIAYTVSIFLTARYLKQQKNYYFVFVMAILSCFTGILGILLGVFTLIEITKPEVKSLFKSQENKARDF